MVLRKYSHLMLSLSVMSDLASEITDKDALSRAAYDVF